MRSKPPSEARASARPWSHLVALLGDRRGPVGLLVVGSLLAGLVESGILALVAQAAAALVSGRSRVTVNAGFLTLHQSITALLIIGIALALIRLALQSIVSVVPARVVADMQSQLRDDVFSAFTRASWREQSLDLEGHLQEILTNQVATAVLGAVQATVVVVTAASFLILVISALVLDFTAALVVVGLSIILFVFLRPISNWGTRRSDAVSLASLDYAESVNESVRIAEEMRVFGVAEPQRAEMRRLLDRVTVPFFHSQLVIRLVPGIYQSLLYLLVVAGLLVLYLSGAGHVASLGAVVLLLVRAGAYGQQAQAAHQVARQAVPYLSRVRQARDRYAQAEEISGDQSVSTIDRLSFEHVSFAYETRRVLHDVSFSMNRHEAIGVIGPSGAGKSTLIQLILRLRHPDEGSYLVNALPARDVAETDWHRLVAYVPQEPRLLHASVTENIRFRRPISDTAVRRAAHLAGIHDEIVAWPAGYDTLIGPRADAISGGQKQRISLARALAAEPELLVLDEPTSSLDPRSEHAIHESLISLRSRLTLVLIAHRLSTLTICDRVLVIVGGEVEAFDDLGTLATSSPYYRSVSTITKQKTERPTPAVRRAR